MKVVRQLDEYRWKEFVNNNPRGNIFHTPEMFHVFACTKGQRPELWAVVDEKENPVALLLPVKITLVNGPFRRFTTRAIVYGSILCAPDKHGGKALSLLLQTYQQEVGGSVLFTELRNLTNLTEFQNVLKANGFAYEEYLNYLINLDRPAEDILQDIGKRTRKIIRKGLRDQVVQVSEVSNRSELVPWYNVLQKTYEKAQVPLADRTMFEAAFDELFPKGMAKFLLAKVNGTVAACSVELSYKNTIYGWYGGTDRSFGKYPSNEMLMWYILEWGANNGYKVYDFGGAGRPGEEYGVRDFKAKFKGELVCFGRNAYVHNSTLLKISILGYKIYRRLL